MKTLWVIIASCATAAWIAVALCLAAAIVLLILPRLLPDFHTKPFNMAQLIRQAERDNAEFLKNSLNARQVCDAARNAALAKGDDDPCIEISAERVFQRIAIGNPANGYTIQNITGGERYDEGYDCFVAMPPPVRAGMTIESKISFHGTSMRASQAAFLLGSAGAYSRSMATNIPGEIVVTCEHAGPGFLFYKF